MERPATLGATSTGSKWNINPQILVAILMLTLSIQLRAQAFQNIPPL